MNRITLSFLLAAVSAVLPAASRAQQAQARPAGVSVVFKDGHQVAATGFRLDGGTLLVTQAVANGTGEVGYPLASIDTVDFPEPPALAAAQAQLAQGKDGEPLTQIDPIVTYYFPFRGVPGNWWLPAALVKLDALAGLKREHEVDALLAEVARLPNNPAAAEGAKLRMAEAQQRHGAADQADRALDDLIKTSSDNDTLARAWIGKGRILLDRRDYEPALLAYLRVPVLYPDNHRSLSDALLGSGRAFVGINQRDQARTTFRQLVDDYPATTAAADAKAELAKLDVSKPAP